MPKFTLDLEYTETASVEVEAETVEEAYQKWLDGDYEDNDIKLDEELYGGIPWSLKRIVDENNKIVKEE